MAAPKQTVDFVTERTGYGADFMRKALSYNVSFNQGIGNLSINLNGVLSEGDPKEQLEKALKATLDSLKDI